MKQTDHRRQIVTECLQILADTARPEIVFNEVINTLSDYPRPKEKRETTTTPPAVLGAYLEISNARNLLKLALLEYRTTKQAEKEAFEHLLNAQKLINE